jgi:flagellar hook-associated protein 1 FlgK
MSGLFSSLNASVNALNAQSYALQIAGKNLANVNNPAYSRETVIFGDRGTVVTPNGAQSLGLEALGVEQIRNTLLDQQLTREISLTSSYSASQQFLQNAQAGLGQNISNTAAAASTGSNAGTGGLGAAIDDFFNAFQGLAAAPTDNGAQQTLLQKAAILTDSFNQADTRLAQVQTDINTQVQGDVGNVNQLLQTIASLNNQIGRVEIGAPNSAVDLRDQRQAALEKLAAYVPFDTSAGANGMVQVTMKDATGAAITVVNGATVTGPVAFTVTGLTAGAAATPVALASGSIYGELSTRDGAVQTLRSSLDGLASQLVTSVNTAYNPSATPGADFFNPAGTTAGTIATAGGLTAASLVAGTGAAGDNSIALAVAAVANQPFSTAGGDAINGTISQAYSNAVSNLGQALSSTNELVTNQTSVQTLVQNQRDSVSGVSLDEEMANIVKYQRAYQASSQVFNVVNGLLDTVINHLGI